MTSFKASYLEIAPDELVDFLLNESNQHERGSINIAGLLDYLKLKYISFNFENELSSEHFHAGTIPRALLSFPGKIIATDEGMSDKRTRFSVLHEIAHYVLPNHHHTLYLCDEKGLGFSAHLLFEKEANEFAANLLFMGNRFILEANNSEISAKTVKVLADRYTTSFEATARRLVEKSFHPCMLIVFMEKPGKTRLNPELEQKWVVRYCAASASFKVKFFTKVSGELSSEVISNLPKMSLDISNSIHRESNITLSNGKDLTFNIEYFTNNHNIFGLLSA